jgi:hypothetical protein
VRAPRVAIVVPAFFAACAAFDAGSETGSPSPAPIAEAGALDRVQPSTDGGGGVKDASAEHDHLPEVGDAAAFCQKAVFCDDFERQAPQGDWPEFDAHGDTVVLPIDPAAPHGTQYLEVIVNPKTATAENWAHTRFFRGIPLGTSRLIDMTFRFYAPALPDGPHANLTALSIPADPPLFAVVYVNKNSVVVVASSDGTQYFEKGSRLRKKDAWDTVRVVLDVDRSLLSVAIEDGSIVEEINVDHGPSNGTVGVELGPSYSDFTTSYTIGFDALEVRAP